ncbi:hypothetical protein Lepto7376_1397 [[Leptolyngbya] sp. PCC 7376]|uniref:DUF4079 domain-containing protein n=1 Tax=[Leptolyngbya] sp. PCC 7376 TaxID=111781 RepID=UPI00029F0C34|nr:DUF4079 domain-containing protein [[Leptolyngbya] sp. PCC 7376]AFY37746.1 hypothetical protein Lepto7376_1397 [[Leptolyngbya] sp. PCC 7376]
MDINLITTWIHPILAVIWVFPLIGIVCYFSWQVRQRRLAIAAGNKSKIPPKVGVEHVNIGRWLAGSVVALSLVGLLHPTITKGFIKQNLMTENLFLGFFVIMMFVLTAASLVFLYRAKTKVWRGTFATLTSMGVIILGGQNWIFRRTNEWYISHYYYGLIATILMIISLAIVQEIYKDKSQKWRKAHIILNIIATLLFIGQGFTGVRDIAEIAFYAAK